MTVRAHWVPGSAFGLPSSLQSLNSLITIGRRGGVPCLIVNANGITLLGWTPFGNMAASSGVMRLELSGYPASSNTVVAPLDSIGNASFRLRILSTGNVRLHNAADTAFG